MSILWFLIEDRDDDEDGREEEESTQEIFKVVWL